MAKRNARRSRRKQAPSEKWGLRGRGTAFETLEDRRLLAIDLSTFKTFLPNALAQLEVQGLKNQILKMDLPLVKDALEVLVGAAGDNATKFFSKINTAITSPLDALTSTASETDLRTALTTNLGDYTVSLTLKHGSVAGPSVEFEFAFARTEANAFTENLPLDAHLGLPGLGIALNANVSASLKLWFEAKVQFGYDGTNFFINTGDANDELAVHAKVELTNGSSLGGKIGLLEFEAKTNGPTYVQINYAGNLGDSANNDGKLTGAEIAAGKIDFANTFSLDTKAKLKLTASFGLPGLNPVIHTDDFSLDWTASGGLPTTIGGISTAPNVSFGHLKMGIQVGLLDGFIKPMLQQVRRFTEPLEPIANMLNSKPLQEKFGLDIKVFDLLQLPPAQREFFSKILFLIDLAKSADSPVLGEIDLGSFELADVRNPTSAFKGLPSELNALVELATKAPILNTALSQFNAGIPPTKGFHIDFLEHTSEIFKLFLGDSNVNLFTFEMPDVGYSDFKEELLASVQIPPFGPALRVDVLVSAGIDIAGKLKMGYDATGLFKFLNDPSSPEKILDGIWIDTSNPLLHVGGLDKDKHATDRIVTFTVKAQAGLGVLDLIDYLGLDLGDDVNKALSDHLDIEFLSNISINVTMDGHLNVGLRGDKPKFRLSDLESDCIFEADGTVSIGGFSEVRATVKGHIPVVQEVLDFFGDLTGVEIVDTHFEESWHEELKRLDPLVLFEFKTECVDSSGKVPAQVVDPKLAWLDPSDGTLRLNLGIYTSSFDANSRKIQPTEINEVYRVEHVSGSPTDAAGETLRVLAFGVSQQFTGVKRIYAAAGKGNDQILLAPEVLAPCELHGGDDDDTLKAGAGVAHLYGDDGKDTLTGGPKADVIFGGAGNDSLYAGAGDDEVFGDAGDDYIDGGIGKDKLAETADANWTLDGNKLTGNGSDTLKEVEVVNLTGGASVNTFTIKHWYGETQLFGVASDDQYIIEVVGTGTSKYIVTDTFGANELLTVRGTGNRDDFTVATGSVKEDNEEVTYTGVERVKLEAQGGQDRINIKSVAATTPVEVFGGADSDLIRVSSLAGANDDGTLASILGALMIDAGSGAANRLVVSNYGGTTAQAIVLKTETDGYSSIGGLTPTAIKYKATGGGFQAMSSAFYADFDVNHGVIVRGSNTTGEQFQVQSTAVNTATKVEGNGGDENFTIAQGNLNAILGKVFVAGGAGSDHIVVDDDGNTLLVDYVVKPDSVTSVNSPDAPAAQAARTFATKGLGYDGTSEFLRLDCTDAKNTIEVWPSLNTELYIDGNLPAPGTVCPDDGDFLKLITTGTTGRKLSMTERGKGQWTFTSGHKAVKFESIEKFNHVEWVAIGAEVGSGGKSKPRVQVLDSETNDLLFEIAPSLTYGASNFYGVHVAMGDLDGDGIRDLIIAPGRNTAPDIKVFAGRPQVGLQGTSMLTISAAQTFGKTFVNGVNVTVGDVTGDCMPDLILSNTLGAPTIKVFENKAHSNGGNAKLVQSHSFNPFADLKNYIGGATIAVGDFDGLKNADGEKQSELVVGTGVGVAARWRIFDLKKPTPKQIKDVLDPTGFKQGINVAAGDVNGDGIAEVVTATGSGGQSWVRVYQANGTQLNSFRAFTNAAEVPNAAVQITLRDLNDDGKLEVLAVQGQDGRSKYKVAKFNPLTGATVDSYFASSPDFFGGGLTIG